MNFTPFSEWIKFHHIYYTTLCLPIHQWVTNPGTFVMSIVGSGAYLPNQAVV